ncbi:MAG: fibrobacter succinogenes major paralogous domain-containing protein [Bacteroidota bacterium]
MKRKPSSRILHIAIMGVLIMLSNSCKKDKESNPSNPENPTNGKTTAVFNPNKTYGTLTDQDGNVYKTIQIGSQIWMAENLRTTKYRDGSVIPEVTDNTAWRNLSTDAYCNYNNTKNSDTIATYGRLYNWYAVSDSRNIAPTGWHVASDAEWTILTDYLGGDSIAGGKMKETDTTHWCNPNTGATNECGFTALPSGLRHSYNGTFGYVRLYGSGWSSTADGASSAWERSLDYSHARCSRSNYGYIQFGFAVRCVKDYVPEK